MRLRRFRLYRARVQLETPMHQAASLRSAAERLPVPGCCFICLEREEKAERSLTRSQNVDDSLFATPWFSLSFPRFKSAFWIYFGFQGLRLPGTAWGAHGAGPRGPFGVFLES